MLRTAIAAVLLVATASAAEPVRLSETPVASYWLRVYPLGMYSEIWRLSVQVPDVKKASSKAVSALEKAGGRSLLPLENMASARVIGKYQQLSFQLPAESAGKAVKALQALGEVQSLEKNPGENAAVAQEAQEKLAKLNADREAGKDALAGLPTVGAMVGEIAAHLEQVVRAHKEASARVLLNVELKEPEPTKRP